VVNAASLLSEFGQLRQRATFDPAVTSETGLDPAATARSDGLWRAKSYRRKIAGPGHRSGCRPKNPSVHRKKPARIASARRAWNVETIRSLTHQREASKIDTGIGNGGFAMEQIVLGLLALGAAYLLARIFIEGCASIDHALMTRKQRRNRAER
jgi:hypothetical protein